MEFQEFVKDRIYLQKLLEIVKREKITFNAIKNHLYYNSSISRDKDNCYLELIYDDLNKYGDKVEITIAHELGHFFNRKNQSLFRRNQIDKIYDKYFTGIHFTKRDRQIILIEERQAWNTGYKILVDIGFENFIEFNSYREDCLKSYAKISLYTNDNKYEEMEL